MAARQGPGASTKRTDALAEQHLAIAQYEDGDANTWCILLLQSGSPAVKSQLIQDGLRIRKNRMLMRDDVFTDHWGITDMHIRASP